MNSDEVFDDNEVHDKLYLLLKENKDVKDFLSDGNDYEILKKKISDGELKRINNEYPNLFELDTTIGSSHSIICITLIRRDLDLNNHIQLKKIKLYIDETNEKILKILQN